MKTLDEFLRSSSDIPDVIGQVMQPPTPVAGMPTPSDPMKPWRSINVEPYMPVAKWFINLPFTYAAKLTNEELWQLDEEEIDTLPLEEAVQKCLYDLRVSRFTEHPYFALAAAVLALGGVKYMALKMQKQLAELLRKEEEYGRQNAEQRRQSERGQGSERNPQNADQIQRRATGTNNLSPFPVKPQPAAEKRSNRSSTNSNSTGPNIRMQAFEDGSSLLDNPGVASLFSSPRGYEGEDE